MSERRPPAEWSVRNGAFIGFCLVVTESVHIPGFGKQGKEPEEDWLCFAIDLRQITHIRQHSHEHAGRCEIYAGSAWIATLNVAATDLMAKWVEVLHAFERIPSTPEARQGRMYAAIDHEAIPTDRPRT